MATALDAGLTLLKGSFPQIDGSVTNLQATLPIVIEAYKSEQTKAKEAEAKVAQLTAENASIRGNVDTIGAEKTKEVDELRRAAVAQKVRGHGALDAGGVLARLRPAVTYEKIGAANLARNLCAAAGVAVGEVEDGEPLAFYAADPGRNALQHLARVYAWHGALAGVDAENRFFARQINAAVAESALRHGRETLAVRQCQGAENIEAIVFAGESAAPSASAATALRPVSDFFAGNRPDGPDLRHRWHFVPALRTATAAAKAGAAALRQQRAMLRRGVLEVFLQPALRPGAVFEVQDQPAGLERGPFWLTGVIHRLTPAGGRSRLHYAGGGAAFDPAALLGALLGSVF